jgi:hypothetical protein
MTPGVKTKTPPAAVCEAEATGLRLSEAVSLAVVVAVGVWLGEETSETVASQLTRTMARTSSRAAFTMISLFRGVWWRRG